jgi:hypothetical protein
MLPNPHAELEVILADAKPGDAFDPKRHPYGRYRCEQKLTVLGAADSRAAQILCHDL